MNTGVFGQIYKLQGTESVPVTIETTKKTSPESEMANFMKEEALLVKKSFFQDGEITVTTNFMWIFFQHFMFLNKFCEYGNTIT